MNHAANSTTTARLLRRVLVALVLPLASGAAAQSQTEETVLHLNAPVDARLNKGETRRYRFAVAAGQYARIEASPTGGDLTLTLSTAEGKKLMSASARYATPDNAVVTIYSNVDAAYVLSVVSTDNQRNPIECRVFIAEMRNAAAADLERFKAEELYAQGEELRDLGTREGRRTSIEKFQAALPYWRAANDPQGEAETYGSMGVAAYLLGDYNGALSAYENALTLARRIGYQKVESEMLNNIAVVYNAQYDNQRALQLYLQALDLFRKRQNFRGEAVCLTNIGSIYTTIRQPEKALQWYEQALALNRKLGDKKTEAAIYTSRGSAQFHAENFQEAIKEGETGLSIARAVGDENRQAIALSNIGSAYLELKRPQEAVAKLAESLVLSKKTGNLRNEAFTLNRLGDASAQLKEPAKALDYLRQSKALYQELGQKILEAFANAKMSQVEMEQGETAAALAHSRESLEIVETVRRRIAGPDLSAYYSASTHHFYETHIEILLQLHRRSPAAGFDIQAFQTSERARARALMEILSDLGTDIRGDATPELLTRETALQKALDGKAIERARLARRPGTSPPEALAQLEKELLQLTTELEQVQGQLRASHPRYAALARPQPIELPEIQRRVIQKDALLLEYFVGRERIYLFAVTNDAANPVHLFEIPDRAALEKAALVFKRRKFEAAAELRRRLSYSHPEFKEKIQFLSDRLLGPARPLLGDKKLLVVSDAFLQMVPFAALLESEDKRPAGIAARGKAEPLIVKHEITHLPSASALAMLRQAMNQRSPASISIENSIAVFADPVFDASDPRVKPAAKAQSIDDKKKESTRRLQPDIADALRDAGEMGENAKLDRLPASREEAQAIAKLAMEDRRLIALDFDANRDRVMRGELGRYRYLHFGTHSFIDDQYPQFSWLALSRVDQQGRKQNGYLRLSDIFKLKLSADLVMLGGCRTGLGKQLSGEGMIGMTRGFMYAGAPRVIVSLWDIPDRETAQLSEIFYRNLLQSRLTPSAALRQAQLALWKREMSPFAWASFTLQGDPD